MNSDAKTLMVFDDPILDYAVEKGVESAAFSATDSMIESADEANNLQRVKDLTLKVKMLENKLKQTSTESQQLVKVKAELASVMKEKQATEKKLIELRAQNTELTEKVQTLSNSRVMEPKASLCASNMDEICQCSGVVYFGEKYARTGATLQRPQLTFSQMLAMPYSVKDMSDGGVMIRCSADAIQGKFGVNIKHPKQCFCDSNPKKSTWEL